MEDNCKKILLDKKYGLKKIERILKRHKFYESGNKDKLLESVSNNPTIFEMIIIELLKKSLQKQVKKMCETLGIDSNSNVDELKKKISDKLKKNIKNKNIKNKIDFLHYAFDKPDLERILKRHKFPKSGNKDKLLEACARNDFIVNEAMTKWKKSKKSMGHIQDMCETLGMDWEGKKGELLQKIEDYVFKNEIKTDIQNESSSKINSSRNMNDISSGFSLTVDPELVNDIVEEIKSYKPSRKTSTELPYETGLHGFLSKSFPQLETQITRGRTRPDIVIGNIAIEIKGPTTMTHITSLGDKLLRYPEFWGKLIIVLFDIQVSDGQLNDIKKATAKHHPDFGILIVK
jgi:ribosomal protein S13